MKSNISDKIKKREKANDVFITPPELALKQIKMIDVIENEVWLDPFKNTGNYYNQYPENVEKDWTEILEGKDFFEYDGKVDVICSNPPYSILNDVIEKCIKLKPRVISMLIGQGNFTCVRMEKLNKAGYGLTKIHFCKVFKWYGMSMMVQFEKDKENIISYDRNVWK